MTKLSEHFTEEEFEFSGTAARAGIENQMGESERANAKRLCELLLEPIRAKFGPVKISSGFRSIEVNRKIGSKDTSQHTKGQAADIQIAGVSPLTVCQWLFESGLPFDQAIHEFGSWSHVSINSADTAPRYMLLTIDKLGTRQGLHNAR